LRTDPVRACALDRYLTEHSARNAQGVEAKRESSEVSLKLKGRTGMPRCAERAVCQSWNSPLFSAPRSLIPHTTSRGSDRPYASAADSRTIVSRLKLIHALERHDQDSSLQDSVSKCNDNDVLYDSRMFAAFWILGTDASIRATPTTTPAYCRYPANPDP
jgi:hypothetical protein